MLSSGRMLERSQWEVFLLTGNPDKRRDTSLRLHDGYWGYIVWNSQLMQFFQGIAYGYISSYQRIPAGVTMLILITSFLYDFFQSFISTIRS